jgi:hypothetical protein
MTSDSLPSLSDRIGPLTPPTAAQINAARHHAAAHARDAADLALLLDVMGLAGETP